MSSRMVLENVKGGKVKSPIRVFLYGPEKVGKTTFGASAPKPVVLTAGHGSDLIDVTRFPDVKTWDEVFEAIGMLLHTKHSFETLVMDELDALEGLLHAKICRANDVGTLAEVGGGYGKGKAAAFEEWRRLVNALNDLYERGMNMVFTAHVRTETIKNPLGMDYDKFSVSISSDAASLFRRWVDAIMFANYGTAVSRVKGETRPKAVSTGVRMLFTEKQAGFDAGNRYGLPHQIPLGWDEFYSRVCESENPDGLRKRIAERLALVPDEEQRGKVSTWLADTSHSISKLRACLNRVNAMIPEDEGEEQPKQETKAEEHPQPQAQA